MRDGAVVLRYGQQSAGKGITNIAWAGETADTREQRIIASLADGSLALYDEQTSQLLAERAGEGAIVGLTIITADSHSGLVQQPTILACTAKGQLSLIPLAHLTSPPSSTSPPSPLTSFSLGDHIARMRLCPLPSSTLVASGGKEQLVRLHDLSTQQCTFKAKNVPHNKLNLRIPVHTTDLVWLPNSDTQLIEGTAHHAVRLYDVRAGKQPVMDASVGEHAVTSLAVGGDGLHFFAADVTGRVVNVDRRKAAVVSAYHGIGGSVRSIVLSADDSQLATASLDRHLRLYDRHTRKMSRKVYLKQKLNVCLFSTQPDMDANVKPEQDGEEAEEQMWKELDERRKLAARKRRVKQEEKDEEVVELPSTKGKQAGAAGDSGTKRQRVTIVKEEEEGDEADEDFAVGELDEEEEADEEEEEDDGEENEVDDDGSDDENDDDECEEEVKLAQPPPPSSRRKAQPSRRAK